MTTRAYTSQFAASLNKARALTCIVSALFAVPVTAAANGMEDANKLFGAGKYAEALLKANELLAKNPRDAQARFLKGLILTQQKKSEEAMAVFTQLTADYPNLPEPHNNIATLFAAAGQYDSARNALEKAIRINPSYATAHENLGDVYAKLAAEEYGKVTALDEGNAAAKSKLKMARNLVVASGAVPDTGSRQAVTRGPANMVTASKTAAALVQSPAPAEARNSAMAKQLDTPNGETNDALNMLNAWAAAWSSRDVEKYLAFYSNDFELPKGKSRQAWINERRARISGKSRISVRIEAPHLQLDGNTATARFRQIYISDQLTDKSSKTLVIEKRNGQWRIIKEQVG